MKTLLFLLAVLIGVVACIILAAWVVTWAIHIAEKEEEKFQDWW